MLAEEVFVTVIRDKKRRGFPQEGDTPDEDFTDSDYAPAPLDAPKVVRRSIHSLLETEFETDVHFASYENQEIPLRLNHGIWFHSDATFMTVDTYDVDCPKTLRVDGRASEVWWQAEEIKIRRLLQVEPVVCFRTRGGYRLLGARKTPFRVDSDAAAEAWSRDYVLRGAFLHGVYNILIDPKCRDFTRVQRAPRAMRDGEREPGIIIGTFGYWSYRGMTLNIATQASDRLARDDVNWRAALTRHEPSALVQPRSFDPTIVWNVDGPEVTAIINHVASCFPASNRHHLCQALGGMLHNRGVAKEVAYHIIYEGARLGGSSDPKTRAKAATDTWRLDPEHAKTAFTRVVEYIGRPAAEHLGHLFTVAEKEALLGRVRKRSAVGIVSSVSTAPATTTSTPRLTTVPSATPVAPSTIHVMDLAELRAEVRRIRRKKSKAEDLRQVSRALYLQRVLDDDALTEPLDRDEVTGQSADEALSETMSTLAWNTKAPWATVSAFIERSMLEMADTDCNFDAWLEKARVLFEDHRTSREVADLRHEEQVAMKNDFHLSASGWQ